jgi:nucleoside-diphosphate-sugar epimerase
MICGNGILAKAFKKSEKNWKDCVILAAGVSNSSEVRDEEYDREKKLIDSYLGTKKTVVYFSTTSVFDDSKQNTKYVKYKKGIELYLLSKFENCVVLRLPIVLSDSNNPNQLMGYLTSKLSNREKIFIYEKASRYFFDVNEVPKALDTVIDAMKQSRQNQKLINIGFQQKVYLTEIAKILKESHPKADIELLKEGSSYFTDFTNFEVMVNDKSTFASANATELLRSYLRKSAK